MEDIINKLIEKDDKFEKIVGKVGSCTIGKNKQNIFSYMIGVIIGQKIRFSQARKIRQQLYTQIDYNFTPQDVLNVDWNNIDISENIKNTILDVTNYVIDNNVKNFNKEFFRNLLNLKGIGEWTVSCIMIEYNIDSDLFPLNDKHVNRKIKEIYGDKKIEDLLKLWTPYKSVVFWYLWKYELN